MESLVRYDIMKHMKENNLFSDKQYGFISGRSTVLQLLTVLDMWTEMLDIGGCVDIIYCDFQKAFDKVSHTNLIDRIKCFGIHSSIIRTLIKQTTTGKYEWLLVQMALIN
jgi:hypothetical protein